MKKTHARFLTIALLPVLLIHGQQASEIKTSMPSGSGDKCFNESTHVINLGVGFFGARYYSYKKGAGYSYNSTPSFGLSYEQAIPQKVGPGLLGIGAYLGYQSAWFKYDNWYYNNNAYYYRHHWRYLYIGARAAYHADALTTDKAELYFGLVAGIRSTKYTYDTNSLDPDRDYYALDERRIGLGCSVFAGGRVYLTDNIGLFAELGYGMSWLTGGLSIKF